MHIPFCKVRCGYCDFYTLASSAEETMARTVDAILLEADLRAPVWSGGPIDSVFIGGGTPSHLGPEILERLLVGLRARVPILEGAEWTVEANPESATDSLLDAALRGGANRISLGLQSMDDAQLVMLDRLHDADGAESACSRARRAGFRNIGCDLIYGLPGASTNVWEETLRRVIGLLPDHVSCYCLALEPRVPMARRGVKLPGDARARSEYDLARRILDEGGYSQYEISNWSMPGTECRHNVNVWRGGNYLGLGPGAHGHLGGVRRANRPDLRSYLARIEAGEDAPHDIQRIEGLARAEERLMLGLRLREGIRWETVDGEFGPEGSSRLRERASAFAKAGLLDDDGTRLRISDSGLFVSNALMVELLGAA